MATRIERILSRADAACQQNGARLTSKRRQLLSTLLQSPQPLSAYELAELYREQWQAPIQPMSVYRMLDFLIEQQLAHKLESTNKFVACTHISCSHEHEVPQFLICDRCAQVQEIGVDQQLVHELQDNVKTSGFLMTNQQLELHGLCRQCRSQS